MPKDYLVAESELAYAIRDAFPVTESRKIQGLALDRYEQVL